MDNFFEFNLHTRIIFGCGKSKELPYYVKQLGGRKVLLVTDPPLAASPLVEEVEANLRASGIGCVVYADVEPNPSLEVVSRGLELLRKEECDLLVGLGGGSSVDTAKAIAFISHNPGPLPAYWRRDFWNHPEDRPGLPCIGIPTTAGTSSEISSTAVIKDPERKVKMGITHRYLAPNVALYDPLLTVTLPPAITAATGMDALTHAIESYTNTLYSPLASDLALRAIALIGSNLRQAVTNGNNLKAREAMLLSNVYAGLAMCNTRLALVHAITAVMGGYYPVPHGVVNAVLLPYVMEYNVIAAPEAHAEVACALGGPTLAARLREMDPITAGYEGVKMVRALMKDIGLPGRLGELGISKEDIPEMCAAATENPIVHLNPRRASQEDMIALCQAAW